MAASRRFARYRKPRAFSITGALPSPAEQRAVRKRRYVFTMGVRTISVVLAAISYQIVWLMLLFAALGTVLPLVAVVTANDRLSRKQLARYGAACRPGRALQRSSMDGVLDE